jgi:hypothetical protein
MATLSISAFTVLSANVDLTALTVGGKSDDDWRVFASLTTTQQKSGGTGAISNFSYAGGSGTDAFNGGASFPRTLSWTDGTPTGSGSNNQGIRQNTFNTTDNRGFSFTVSGVGTGEQTCRVFVGRYSDNTNANNFRITASISDGSTGTQTSDLVGITSDQDGYYDITMAANSASQTVTITWQSNTTASNFLRAVNLRGAWLSTPTSGGTIHNAIITESVTAIEAGSAQAAFNTATTEAATASEASASNIITSAAIAESITAIDASLSSINTQSAVTETGTASEASDATVTNNPAVVETLTAIESSSVSMVAVSSISEAVTADSSQTNTLVTSAAASEAGSATEASAATYVTDSAATESATASDEQDAAITIAELDAEITETLTASAEATSQLTANAEIVESGEANDASFSGSIFSALIEEILNATDSSTVVYKLVKRVVDGALQIREVGSSLVRRVFTRNLTERNPEDF